MTRNAKRAVVVASFVAAATVLVVASGVRDARVDAAVPEATERYDAYDGGPLPLRRLYEPLLPVVILGVPHEADPDADDATS